jgi:hypothetical protein
MFRWDKVSVPKKLGRKLFVANAVLFAGSFGVLLWMRKSSFVTCSLQVTLVVVLRACP